MSVQFIANRNQSGYQARVYTKAPKYVSEFFAVNTYGTEEAKRLAVLAEKRLKRKVRKERA